MRETGWNLLAIFSIAGGALFLVVGTPSTGIAQDEGCNGSWVHPYRAEAQCTSTAAADQWCDAMEMNYPEGSCNVYSAYGIFTIPYPE